MPKNVLFESMELGYSKVRVLAEDPNLSNEFSRRVEVDLYEEGSNEDDWEYGTAWERNRVVLNLSSSQSFAMGRALLGETFDRFEDQDEAIHAITSAIFDLAYTIREVSIYKMKEKIGTVLWEHADFKKDLTDLNKELQRQLVRLDAAIRGVKGVGPMLDSSPPSG